MVVAAVLAVWQGYVMLAAVPKWLLPSPLQIVSEGWSILPRIMVHTAATAKITIIGFIIGTIGGMAAAMLLHAVFPALKSGFYPLLILTQNIPLIVLAPLLAIWFGFGLLPKLIVITLVCFFPVTVAMMQGLEQTDPDKMNYMRMIGAGRGLIFRKLELPYSLPYLFSGLKISATYSVMGAVISEWTGAKHGLGVFMMLQKSAFRTDRVFVAIAVIVGLSLLLFGLILVLENWLIRWQPEGGKGPKP